MPIPEKKENEDNQQFLSRCMSNETMKKEYTDTKQRTAICMSQIKNNSNSNSLLEKFYEELFINTANWDEEWQEFTWEITLLDDYIYNEDDNIIASQYKGRKVTLNKPFRTPDGPKKFSVYVKNDKGNVVKVNFGDPNMKIKKNIPERRKSFRARHNCDNPGPKWKARYWSCKAW
jgi:hypothetical protein